MQDERISENDAPHEETRAKYERYEAELMRELEKVRAVLKALGGASEDAPIPKVGATAQIDDITDFLKQKGAPAHQYEIISKVGDKRTQEYPHMKKVYEKLWKSLEYHNREDSEVVCVEWRESKLVRGELKKKLRKPRIKGAANRPEYYREPENLFWLKGPAED
jgi:hypothetical protein